MKKMDLKFKISLIAKIKGLAEEAKNTRKKMYSFKEVEDKPEYIKYRSIKEYIKIDARHHLLAYAYMRGIPYSVLEKKCNITASPQLILKVVVNHSWFYGDTDKLLNLIRNWLEGK